MFMAVQSYSLSLRIRAAKLASCKGRVTSTPVSSSTPEYIACGQSMDHP